MAAQPEPVARTLPELHADPSFGVGQPEGPAATRGRLTAVPAHPHPASNDVPDHRLPRARLGPAGGLLFGLSIGALLWAGIGVLAWRFFHAPSAP